MSGYVTLIVMMLVMFASLAIFLVHDDETDLSTFDDGSEDGIAFAPDDSIDVDQLESEWHAAALVSETEKERASKHRAPSDDAG